ncbi:Dynein heavy chain like protein, partial [Aduncisulcus paluster]
MQLQVDIANPTAVLNELQHNKNRYEFVYMGYVYDNTWARSVSAPIVQEKQVKQRSIRKDIESGTLQRVKARSSSALGFSSSVPSSLPILSQKRVETFSRLNLSGRLQAKIKKKRPESRLPSSFHQVLKSNTIQASTTSSIQQTKSLKHMLKSITPVQHIERQQGPSISTSTSVTHLDSVAPSFQSTLSNTHSESHISPAIGIRRPMSLQRRAMSALSHQRSSIRPFRRLEAGKPEDLTKKRSVLHTPLRSNGFPDIIFKTPYDLVILPYEAVDKRDYFTVSVSGVTRYIDGNPEFISAADYVREREIFVKLYSIPFFRSFKARKAIKIWRSAVKSVKFMRNSNHIAKTLLYSIEGYTHKIVVTKQISRHAVTHSFGDLKKLPLPLTLNNMHLQFKRTLSLITQRFDRVARAISKSLFHFCREVASQSGMLATIHTSDEQKKSDVYQMKEDLKKKKAKVRPLDQEQMDMADKEGLDDGLDDIEKSKKISIMKKLDKPGGRSIERDRAIIAAKNKAAWRQHRLKNLIRLCSVVFVETQWGFILDLSSKAVEKFVGRDMDDIEVEETMERIRSRCHKQPKSNILISSVLGQGRNGKTASSSSSVPSTSSLQSDKPSSKSGLGGISFVSGAKRRQQRLAKQEQIGEAEEDRLIIPAIEVIISQMSAKPRPGSVKRRGIEGMLFIQHPADCVGKPNTLPPQADVFAASPLIPKENIFIHKSHSHSTRSHATHLSLFSTGPYPQTQNILCFPHRLSPSPFLTLEAHWSEGHRGACVVSLAPSEDDVVGEIDTLIALTVNALNNIEYIAKEQSLSNYDSGVINTPFEYIVYGVPFNGEASQAVQGVGGGTDEIGRIVVPPSPKKRRGYGLINSDEYGGKSFEDSSEKTTPFGPSRKPSVQSSEIRLKKAITGIKKGLSTKEALDDMDPSVRDETMSVNGNWLKSQPILIKNVHTLRVAVLHSYQRARELAHRFNYVASISSSPFLNIAPLIARIKEGDVPLYCEFQEKISGLNDLLKTVDHARRRISCGCLCVDFLPLYSTIQPLIASALQAILDCMPPCVSIINKAFTYRCEELKQAIQEPVSSLGQCIAILKAASDTETDLPYLQQQLDHMVALKSLLSDNSITVDNVTQLCVEGEELLLSLRRLLGSFKRNQVIELSSEFRDDLRNRALRTRQRIEEVSQRVVSAVYLQPTLDAYSAVNELTELDYTVKEAMSEAEEIAEAASLFTVEVPEADLRAEAEACVLGTSIRLEAWQFVGRWRKCEEQYVQSPLSNLDINILQDEIDDCMDGLIQAERTLRDCPFVTETLFRLRIVKRSLKIVSALLNSGLRVKHWKTIYAILSIPYDSLIQKPLEVASIDSLLMAGILSMDVSVTEVTDIARAEAAVVDTLDKLDSEWKTIQFEFKRLGKGIETNGYTLENIPQILERVDDARVTISALQGAPYVPDDAIPRVQEWASLLWYVKDTLRSWGEMQAHWRFMGTVFSNRDVQRILQSETRQYKKVDSDFRKATDSIRMAPNVILGLRQKDMKELPRKLNQWVSALEKCHQALTRYLAEKRGNNFRLCFLSDSELIDLLSSGRNVNLLTRSLPKLFPGIRSMKTSLSTEFGGNEVVAVFADKTDEEEMVPLQPPVKIRSGPEHFIQALAENLKISMRKEIEHCFTEAMKNFDIQHVLSWTLQFPMQIALVVRSGIFTSIVDTILRRQVVTFLFPQLNTEKIQVQKVSSIKSKKKKQRKGKSKSRTEYIPPKTIEPVAFSVRSSFKALLERLNEEIKYFSTLLQKSLIIDYQVISETEKEENEERILERKQKMKKRQEQQIARDEAGTSKKKPEKTLSAKKLGRIIHKKMKHVRKKRRQEDFSLSESESDSSEESQETEENEELSDMSDKAEDGDEIEEKAKPAKPMTPRDRQSITNVMNELVYERNIISKFLEIPESSFEEKSNVLFSDSMENMKDKKRKINKGVIYMYDEDLYERNIISKFLEIPESSFEEKSNKKRQEQQIARDEAGTSKKKPEKTLSAKKLGRIIHKKMKHVRKKRRQEDFSLSESESDSSEESQETEENEELSDMSDKAEDGEEIEEKAKPAKPMTPRDRQSITNVMNELVYERNIISKFLEIPESSFEEKSNQKMKKRQEQQIARDEAGTSKKKPEKTLSAKKLGRIIHKKMKHVRKKRRQEDFSLSESESDSSEESQETEENEELSDMSDKAEDGDEIEEKAKPAKPMTPRDRQSITNVMNELVYERNIISKFLEIPESSFEEKSNVLFSDSMENMKDKKRKINKGVIYMYDEDHLSFNPFIWESHLKTVVTEQGNVFLEAGGVSAKYGYEFLGSRRRLCISPLTERSCITMLTALDSICAGGLSGSSGVGKTETTLELAYMLGRHYYRVNCFSNLTLDTIGRIVCGIVRIGSIGIFDEVTRLSAEVLSVLAQHILTVQSAVRSGSGVIDMSSFVTESGVSIIAKNPKIGIPTPPPAFFATINPNTFSAFSTSVGGSGGNSKHQMKNSHLPLYSLEMSATKSTIKSLPQSIAPMFRLSHIVEPDICVIAEHLLLIEGFTNCKKLGNITSISLQVISLQCGVFLSLRTVRTIATMAGQDLRLYREDKAKEEEELEKLRERELLLSRDLEKEHEKEQSTFTESSDQSTNQSKMIPIPTTVTERIDHPGIKSRPSSSSLIPPISFSHNLPTLKLQSKQDHELSDYEFTATAPKGSSGHGGHKRSFSTLSAGAITQRENEEARNEQQILFQAIMDSVTTQLSASEVTIVRRCVEDVFGSGEPIIIGGPFTARRRASKSVASGYNLPDNDDEQSVSSFSGRSVASFSHMSQISTALPQMRTGAGFKEQLEQNIMKQQSKWREDHKIKLSVYLSDTLQLNPSPKFLEKGIQVIQRINSASVVIVGPSNCGKTTLIDAAAHALARKPIEHKSTSEVPKMIGSSLSEPNQPKSKGFMNRTKGLLMRLLKRKEHPKQEVQSIPPTIKRIYPSLLSSGELCGTLDLTSGKWTDGVLTRIIRSRIQNHADSVPIHSDLWVVFDGDLNSEWAESLNSLFDDTRTLSLASGETLSIPEDIRFIIETTDTSQATPSTLSRMSVVYMSHDTVDYTEKGSVFINKLSESLNISKGSNFEQFSSTLSVWFSHYLPILENFTTDIRFIIETTDTSQATPSTLSRMSVVYMSHDTVDYTEKGSVFINKLSESLNISKGSNFEQFSSTLSVWFSHYLPILENFTTGSCYSLQASTERSQFKDPTSDTLTHKTTLSTYHTHRRASISHRNRSPGSSYRSNASVRRGHGDLNKIFPALSSTSYAPGSEHTDAQDLNIPGEEIPVNGLFLFFRIFAAILSVDADLLEYVKTSKKMSASVFLKSLGAHFIFSLAWSYGGSAREEGQAIMSDNLRRIHSTRPVTSLPPGGAIHEYVFSLKKRTFVRWEDNIGDNPPITDFESLSSFFVPTPSSLAISTLTGLMMFHGFPMLITGDPCSGKSLVGRNAQKHAQELVEKKLEAEELQLLHQIVVDEEHNSEAEIIPDTLEKTGSTSMLGQLSPASPTTSLPHIEREASIPDIPPQLSTIPSDSSIQMSRNPSTASVQSSPSSSTGKIQGLSSIFNQGRLQSYEDDTTITCMTPAVRLGDFEWFTASGRESAHVREIMNNNTKDGAQSTASSFVTHARRASVIVGDSDSKPPSHLGSRAGSNEASLKSLSQHGSMAQLYSNQNSAPMLSVPSMVQGGTPQSRGIDQADGMDSLHSYSLNPIPIDTSKVSDSSHHDSHSHDSGRLSIPSARQPTVASETFSDPSIVVTMRAKTDVSEFSSSLFKAGLERTSFKRDKASIIVLKPLQEDNVSTLLKVEDATLPSLNLSKYNPTSSDLNFDESITHSSEIDKLSAMYSQGDGGDVISISSKGKAHSVPCVDGLRVLVDHGVVYIREEDKSVNLAHVHGINMLFISGSRGKFEDRMKGKCGSFRVSTPSFSTLKRIFSHYFDQWLFFRGFDHLNHLIDPIISASITFMNELSECLPPLPSCPHYIYNSHTLVQVFKGLFRLDQRAIVGEPPQSRLKITMQIDKTSEKVKIMPQDNSSNDNGQDLESPDGVMSTPSHSSPMNQAQKMLAKTFQLSPTSPGISHYSQKRKIPSYPVSQDELGARERKGSLPVNGSFSNIPPALLARSHDPHQLLLRKDQFYMHDIVLTASLSKKAAVHTRRVVRAWTHELRSVIRQRLITFSHGTIYDEIFSRVAEDVPGMTDLKTAELMSGKKKSSSLKREDKVENLLKGTTSVVLPDTMPLPSSNSARRSSVAIVSPRRTEGESLASALSRVRSPSLETSGIPMLKHKKKLRIAGSNNSLERLNATKSMAQDTISRRRFRFEDTPRDTIATVTQDEIGAEYLLSSIGFRVAAPFISISASVLPFDEEEVSGLLETSKQQKRRASGLSGPLNDIMEGDEELFEYSEDSIQVDRSFQIPDEEKKEDESDTNPNVGSQSSESTETSQPKTPVEALNIVRAETLRIQRDRKASSSSVIDEQLSEDSVASASFTAAAKTFEQSMKVGIVHVLDLPLLFSAARDYVSKKLAHSSTKSSFCKKECDLTNSAIFSYILSCIEVPQKPLLICAQEGAVSQSIVQAASVLCGARFFATSIRNTALHFRESMKDIVVSCGVRGDKGVLFVHALSGNLGLLGEFESLFTEGSFPFLFEDPAEEERIVFAPLREVAKERHILPTPTRLFALAADRVRMNLRVVILLPHYRPFIRSSIDMAPSLWMRACVLWASPPSDAVIRATCQRDVRRLMGNEALTTMFLDKFLQMKHIEEQEESESNETDQEEEEGEKTMAGSLPLIHTPDNSSPDLKLLRPSLIKKPRALNIGSSRALKVKRRPAIDTNESKNDPFTQYSSAPTALSPIRGIELIPNASASSNPMITKIAGFDEYYQQFKSDEHDIVRAILRIFFLVKTKEMESVKSEIGLIVPDLRRFISLFGNLLFSKLSSLKDRITSLNNGIDHIHSAKTIVEKTKQELIELEPQLNAAREEVSILMSSLAMEKEQLIIMKETSVKERNEARFLEEEIDEEHAIASEELKEIMPALEGAKAVVEGLDRTNFNEVRSFTTPARPVVVILESVCMLLYRDKFKETAGGWGGVKKIMGEPRFLHKLKNFNTDEVSQEHINEVEKYLKCDEFQPEAALRASSAAAALGRWVKAVIRYYYAFKKVKPKLKKLKETEKRHALALAQVKEKEGHVDELDVKIKQLQADVERKNLELIELANEIDSTRRRRSKAEQLVSSCIREKALWTHRLEKQLEEQRCLTGTCIVSAAIFSLVMMLPPMHRFSIIHEIINIVKQIGLSVLPSFITAIDEEVEEQKTVDVQYNNALNQQHESSDSHSSSSDTHKLQESSRSRSRSTTPLLSHETSISKKDRSITPTMPQRGFVPMSMDDLGEHAEESSEDEDISSIGETIEELWRDHPDSLMNFGGHNTAENGEVPKASENGHSQHKGLIRNVMKFVSPPDAMLSITDDTFAQMNLLSVGLSGGGVIACDPEDICRDLITNLQPLTTTVVSVHSHDLEANIAITAKRGHTLLVTDISDRIPEPLEAALQYLNKNEGPCENGLKGGYVPPVSRAASVISSAIIKTGSDTSGGASGSGASGYTPSRKGSTHTPPRRGSQTPKNPPGSLSSIFSSSKEKPIEGQYRFGIDLLPLSSVEPTFTLPTVGVINVARGFNVILITTHHAAKIPSIIRSTCSVIDFGVVYESVVQRALNIIVSIFHSDLQLRDDRLQQEIINDKFALEKADKQTLDILSSSDFFSSSDKVLQTLAESQHQAQQASTRLQKTRTLREVIDKTKTKYFELASLGARFAFAHRALVNLCDVYASSITSYLIHFANFLTKLKKIRDGDPDSYAVLSGRKTFMYNESIASIATSSARASRTASIIGRSHPSTPVTPTMSGSISLASSSQYMNKLRSSLSSSSSSSSSSPSQPSSMFNANYSMSANVTDVQVPKVSRKMIRSIWRKCISEYGTLLTKFLRPCDVIPA